jgi:hypothetical protein
MSLMPDYMCREELKDGRLVEVLPGWAPPHGVFHAVYPSRRGMVPAVRRFLDFLYLLLNVSYDVAREFYKDYNAAFRRALQEDHRQGRQDRPVACAAPAPRRAP